MPRRILIIQSCVPKYRIGIFNLLANENYVERLDVTTTLDPELGEPYEFGVVNINLRRIGPLVFTSGVRQLADKYDVIVAMFDLKWSFLYYLLFSENRKKLILWGHGFGRNVKSNIKRMIRIGLAKRARALLFYDFLAQAQFVEHGISGDKCFVASNTITNAYAGMNIDQEKDSFIFVGRLIKGKNLDLLFDAFQAAFFDTNMGLDIVGDGPEFSAIVAKVKELGLEKNVKLHGEIHDQRQLRDLFGAAYAYIAVCPTGLGFVHSFSFGCPVITYETSNHGPEYSYCNHANTLLFNGKSEDLCTQMILISSDTSKRKEMSTASYETYIGKANPRRMLDGFNTAIDFVSNS